MTARGKKKVLGVAGAMLVFLGGMLLAGEASATTGTAEDPATSEQVIQYLRDRFGVPDTVKLTAGALRASEFSGLYQASVVSDDGKQKHTNEIFLTRDARCLIMGNLFALNGPAPEGIRGQVRRAAKLPPEAKLSLEPFKQSVFPEFLKSLVTVEESGKKQSGEVYVTRDYRLGILGVVYPFRRDFVESLIDTKNQPSVGPASAPVTIVEYADLECPHCAAFQKFLDDQFLPKYGSRVRVIFKEDPLSMHPWAMTAAIGSECAGQIEPSEFLNYRSLVFSFQDAITAANVREELLGFGQNLGIDQTKLAACIDSKASLPRVQADQREAEELEVTSTPTVFVNGRIVLGDQLAIAFDNIVDQALTEASGANRTPRRKTALVRTKLTARR